MRPTDLRSGSNWAANWNVLTAGKTHSPLASHRYRQLPRPICQSLLWRRRSRRSTATAPKAKYIPSGWIGVGILGRHSLWPLEQRKTHSSADKSLFPISEYQIPPCRRAAEVQNEICCKVLRCSRAESESHAVIDFKAGSDWGWAYFHRPQSLGVRLADFTSASHANVIARPEVASKRLRLHREVFPRCVSHRLHCRRRKSNEAFTALGLHFPGKATSLFSAIRMAGSLSIGA